MTGRLTIRLAGESGQGINSIGEALSKSFKKVQLFTFGYREYPSLIRGGHAFYQVEVADQPINAASAQCDVMVCMSRVSFHAYVKQMRPKGILIHDIGRLDITPQEQAWIDQQQLQIIYLNAAELAEQSGGKKLMSNTVIFGVLWQLLDLPLAAAEENIREAFAKKPHYIDVNLACLRTGYAQQIAGDDALNLTAGSNAAVSTAALLTGNHALALGAIAAGVRAFFAYPMTPSSSILTYLAQVQHQTGMLVKQADDEIAAAQMTIGSMFMGTRALTATSGGGFDLMTESVSLAGMTETPFVCILGQRPGPATGLPTWTSAGDLLLAVFAGHGEFPRVVLAASDAQSAYRIIQEAFNIAEEYQLPVMVLTEKQIAESAFMVTEFPTNPEIKRGLLTNEELETTTTNPTIAGRYALTETGISPRWLPGQADATYDANSDEHLADGSLTEDAESSRAMMDKRMRKLITLQKHVPEPLLFGPQTADVTFVGWGSVKSSIIDALAILEQEQTTQSGDQLTYNYLHFEYIYPLPTITFNQITKTDTTLVLVENNATGQLGQLISQATGYQFAHRFLKYDGRPFFIEDILSFIKNELPISMKGQV
jgi:2-oxoglutarate ferredoxin oxidoreductase subunit alpha